MPGLQDWRGLVYKIDGEDSSIGWVERCGQQYGWMEMSSMGGAVWFAVLERTGLQDLIGLVYRMGGGNWDRGLDHRM